MPTTEHITTDEARRALAVAKRYEKEANGSGGSEDRLTFYHSVNREPFEGVSVKDSDKIRAYLGARYAGFTTKESYAIASVSPNKMHALNKSFPDAIQQCHNEIQEAVAREHYTNAAFMTAAMSEYCPMALKVMYKLMMDTSQSGSLRAKIAKDIIDMGMKKSDGSHVAEEFMVQLSDTIASSLKGIENKHIVDKPEIEALPE